jgi:predicted MPP superfamily phosphohydrolase
MIIKPISDIHMSHHADHGTGFLGELSTDHDVLVVAGDLTAVTLKQNIQALCAKQRHCDIVYVLGNHEYYGNSFDGIDKYFFERKGRAIAKNLHVTENKVIIIQGQRFVGTSMWYSPTNNAVKLFKTWSDFSNIKDSHKIFERNAIAKKFLQENVREGDIVTTHTAPSFLSVPPRYAGDPYNAFFVCDMEELIKERKPKYWIHGHIHTFTSYKLHDTIVVCNPAGYPREAGTSSYRADYALLA